MVSSASMEPLLPESNRDLEDTGDRTDLFRQSLRRTPASHHALIGSANLVRSMNCYYSIIIEGHNTLPIDIDRAMAGDFCARTRETQFFSSRLAPISRFSAH